MTRARAELADEIERLATAETHADAVYEAAVGKVPEEAMPPIWGTYTTAALLFDECVRRNLLTILAALREPDEAAVERAAVALFNRVYCNHQLWADLHSDAKETWLGDARTCLRAAREG